MMSLENSTWYLVSPGSKNYFASIAFASYNEEKGGDCAFISHGAIHGTYVPSDGRFIIRMGTKALWTGAVLGSTGTGFATNLPFDTSNPPTALPYNLTSKKPVHGKLDKNSEEYNLLKMMMAG